MWQTVPVSHFNNKTQNFLGVGNIGQTRAILTSAALDCSCVMKNPCERPGKTVGLLWVYRFFSTFIASHAWGEACIYHHLRIQEPEECETQADAASSPVEDEGGW